MFQQYQLSIHYRKVCLCDVFWNFTFLSNAKEMWLLRIIANSIASYEFHGYHKLRQCNSPGISIKGWCVQWLLFVGPPEPCGQHKVGGILPLLCQIDSDVVQCKYQDLCTDSYSQANKPIMPTIHTEFELKSLKVCTHEKITRTEGDTLPLHVWHVRYEMKLMQCL